MQNVDPVVKKVMSMISVIAILVFSLFGLNYDALLLKMDYDVIENAPVSMVAEVLESVPAKGTKKITFNVAVTGGEGEEYSLSPEYILQKQVNDGWGDVPVQLGMSYEGDTIVLNAGNTAASFDFMLGMHYPLNAGQYRLIKTVAVGDSSFMIAAEFALS